MILMIDTTGSMGTYFLRTSREERENFSEDFHFFFQSLRSADVHIEPN